MARTQVRGNTQIKAGTIGNTEIATDASIALSKLAMANDWDTSGSLRAGVVANVEVATDAAIAVSKLESIGDASFVIGDGTTNNKLAITGDISVGNDGVAAIGTGVIINADVKSDAAIEESKLSFDTTSGHNHDGTNSRIVDSASVGAFDVNRETPTGLIDGTNTTYTCATSPTAGSEHVWLNGILQEDGTAADYTISGAVITFIDAPASVDRLLVSYGTN